MKIIHFIFLTLICLPAHGEVMLLIHGYLGDANSWEQSGINDELHHQGWLRAGMFRGSSQGPKLFTTEHSNKYANEHTNEHIETKKLVYVAELPSNSPIITQADVLFNIIQTIQNQHPHEKLILVGHSAGGVVARMTIVRHQLKNISALITIASPHIGTGRADQALAITGNHGPFNMVKSFVGGRDYDALKNSRGLMADLRRPQPNNMLYWLNNQAHPKIHYASIIRLNNKGSSGDYYVPGFSQNMNNIPVLQGQSSTFTTPTSHFLTRQDANTLLTMINRF